MPGDISNTEAAGIFAVPTEVDTEAASKQVTVDMDVMVASAWICLLKCWKKMIAWNF